MALKYHCEIEGLEANYVEVVEIWTRAELRDLVEADESNMLGWLQLKIEGCRLETVAGRIVEKGSEINEDLLDELDLRLLQFLGTVLLQAGVYLRSLGNLSGRLSLNGLEHTNPAKE